ncbi:MAG: molecular chaperone HtpG [Candidatus Caenarcaniphilales bacterium]|nr:molecular chaperone HtpG [Candidatus Caenarcaniphilales bacterium]
MTTTAENNSSTRSFEAEVKQVLDLVIHSLYSNKEIFLRELISNSSDALDKLRFLALSNKDLIAENEELAVKLFLDEEKRRLIIRDNGIGMNEEDLINNLGTIAKSGTKEFLKLIKEKNENPDFNESLIGQFGVGFYSAFIVADRVTVLTRKAATEDANETKAMLWQSNAEGTYTIREASDEDFNEYATESEAELKQGTKIILDLKEDTDEDSEFNSFLKEYQIRSIVKKYSDFIEYPIKVRTENPEIQSANYRLETIKTDLEKAEKEGEGNEKKEELIKEQSELEEKLKSEPKFVFEVLNSQKAIWTKNKSDISNEEYQDFYKHISNDFNNPLTHIHYKAEGTNEFTALLYLPEKAPFDLFMQEQVKSLQLYINKVFITNESDLLVPKYLRFIKGVVDSSDLPLNVSRELLQDNHKVANIKKNITKKVLKTLKDVLKKNRAQYDTFFSELGKVLKEGVHFDHANQEQILELLTYESNQKEAEQTVTLDEYIEKLDARSDLPEETRKNIYVITGESRAELESSPYLEAFKAKDIEVLLMTDAVDEWVIMSAPQYKGKTFKAINKGKVDLGENEEEKAEKEKKQEEFKDLISKIQGNLNENVSEVRFTDRLVNTLACLVVNDHDISANLEKIYKNAQQDVPTAKRILELNPEHRVVEKLNAEFTKDPESQLIKDYSELIYYQALLLEGSKVDNLNRYNELVTNLM